MESGSGLLIDVEAAEILRSATQAVSAILERRAALDREGRANETLFVLAGEFHEYPAHKIHHMLVHKGLQESGERSVYGYELPHNLLAAKFSEAAEIVPDTALLDRVAGLDDDGGYQIECFSSFRGAWESDHATKIMLRRLQYGRGSMPVRFTDAARAGQNIDKSDPSTAESLRECGISAGKTTNFVLSDGVRVRNHHMTRLMTDFARGHNARIAVQICGDVHVAGALQEGYAPSESLSSYFKAQNAPVLALPLFTGQFTAWQFSAYRHLEEEETWALPPLPSKTAVYHPKDDTPDPQRPADFQSRTDEAYWVNGILKRVGLYNDQMSVEEYHRDLPGKKIRMNHLFRQWQKDFFPGF